MALLTPTVGRLGTYLSKSPQEYLWQTNWPAVLAGGIDYLLWWVLACLLVGIAYLRSRGEGEASLPALPAEPTLERWSCRLLLMLVLAAGLVLRLLKPETHPYCLGDDHAWNCLFALDSFHGKRLITPFTLEDHSKETLFMFLMAPFLLVLGNTVRAAVIFMAMVGTATSLAAYALASRAMRSRWYGLLAAALVSAAPGFLADGRIPARRLLCPLVMGLVLAMVHQAVRTERRAAFIALGAAIGLGLHTYHTFRLIPVAAVATVVFMAFLERDFVRRNAGKLLAGLIAGIVVFGPIAYFPLYQWAFYNERGGDELGNFLREGNLGQNLKWFFQHLTPYDPHLPFTDSIDISFSYHPTVVFPLFFIGWAVALRRWKDPFHLFALLSFSLVSITYLLNPNTTAPDSHRSNTLMTIYVLWSLLGLRALESRFRRWRRPLLIGAVIALTLGQTIVGALDFLDLKGICLEEERETAQLAGRLHREGWEVRILDRYWSPVVAYLAYEVPDHYDLQGSRYLRSWNHHVEEQTRERLTDLLSLPPDQLAGYRILLLVGEHDPEEEGSQTLIRLEDTIRRLAPDAEIIDVHSPRRPGTRICRMVRFPVPGRL